MGASRSQDGGSQAGASRTGRHTRGEWRLPSLAGYNDVGDCSPAMRAPRPPPLPPGATFGQLYELMLVVDSREQVCCVMPLRMRLAREPSLCTWVWCDPAPTQVVETIRVVAVPCHDDNYHHMPG